MATLKSLSSKPKLVQLIIDDEDTIRDYGEAVEFWTYDRQPLHTYLEISQTFGKDPVKTEALLSGLLFEEDGTKSFNEGEMPDANLMAKALTKVMEKLGKSQRVPTVTSLKATRS
jgi:hypothetical protein